VTPRSQDSAPRITSGTHTIELLSRDGLRVIHNNETNLIEHTHGVMLPNLEGRVLEEIQKFLHVERLVPIDVKVLEDLHQRLFASHARIMNQALELHRNLIRA
jgi:hypothetical protein